MSFQINIVAGAFGQFAGTMLDASGNPISITAGSDVLLKLFRGNPGTPDLDISGTQLTGGTITFFTAGTGAWGVKFFGADTAVLNPQTYDARLYLVDAGNNNAETIVDEGVVCVLGTVSGKST